VALGWDVCPKGKMSCPPKVIDEMYGRWGTLDQSCDHDAVFALTYLRTTEEFFRTVSDEPETFSDIPWINHADAVFAEFYFHAYDAYQVGKAVPAAWEIAFDTARSPHVPPPVAGERLAQREAPGRREDLAGAHPGLAVDRGRGGELRPHDPGGRDGARLRSGPRRLLRRRSLSAA
jgi:hypothetical protein